MGAIVKGVGSLFGGRKRRREQKAANKAFGAAEKSVDEFDFKNPLAGATATQAGAQGYDAVQQGPAAQAQLAELGPAAQATAQGYEAEGYEGQGYDAAQAEAAQAERVNLGEETGRTNQFANLAVNTAAADRQAAESDEALAAALESGAITGASGATALAQQAAKSKQGISDTISQQESQIQQLAAQGATDVQREDLAQRNLSRQSDVQQSQFNTGLQQQTNLANQAATNQASQFSAAAQNQANQFSAGARNQAAQFGAAAQNQASQFNAGAQNQFAQARFGAANQLSQFNAGAQNQVAAQNAQLANTAAQFGAAAANNASQFNAQAANNLQSQQAQYAHANQTQKFQALNDKLGRAGQRKSAADQARQQATNDLVGGISAGANLLFSDERLKDNIVKVGVSNDGHNIYEFNYKNEVQRWQGVMAQEMPDDVVEERDGFLAVDYNKIDVDFKSI